MSTRKRGMTKARRRRVHRAYMHARREIRRYLAGPPELHWIDRERVASLGHRYCDVSAAFAWLQKDRVLGHHFRPTVPSDVAYARRFPILTDNKRSTDAE